jgi:hypothetical protein
VSARGGDIAPYSGADSLTLVDRSIMSGTNDSPSSGNAINQPWPIETVREIVEERPQRRAELFKNELSQRLPNHEQTTVMLHIASTMAQRTGKNDNGGDSIWIYTGHPEESSKSFEQPSDLADSVIERLGHVGLNGFTKSSHIIEGGTHYNSTEEIITYTAKLYKHSPVCLPAHQQISQCELEARVRGALKRYDKI